MKTKNFFSLISMLCLGLFCQTAFAQVPQAQGTRDWDDQSALVIYVDQQNPARLHLESRYGKPFSCAVSVTIDYEVKPMPGQPTDPNGKIIRHFTVTLRAGQVSTQSDCNDILYYPCHNGLPVVTPGSCDGNTLSASFDDNKFFPTFGMEYYPNYQ